MRSLILHPNSVAQWHSVLLEAQQKSSIFLKEELEYYLMNLLLRSMREHHWVVNIVGMDFLHSCQMTPAPQKLSRLKDIGDRCLLLAGLFPGQASKRRVKVSYFVNIGQTAYSQISYSSHSYGKLYIELAKEFVNLMDVLQFIREDQSAHDFIQSLELWQQTGSKAAWQRWVQMFGPPPSLKNPKKH